MIKSIYLKNWRSHSESFVSFDRGTNLLIGRMGGGKTSIIDGICFALFGTCPSIQQRKIALSDLIRNRPEQQDYSEVSVKFVLGDDEYEVSRRIVRNGKNSAQLEKNGKLITSSPERVTEYIEQLLDLDYDLFTRAIYSEQNRIDYFLTLQKRQRKEQIDELLGLSRFEQLRQNITKLINRLSDMLYDKMFIINSININEITKEIENLKEEEKKIEEKISKLKNEKKNKEKILKEKKAEFDTIERMKEEYEQIENKLNGINRSIEIIEKELAAEGIEIKTERSKTFEILSNDLAESEHKLAKIKENIEGLKSGISAFEKKLNEVSKAIYRFENLKKEISEIEKDITAMEREISSNLEKSKTSSVNDLEQKLNDLEEKKKVLSEKIFEKKAMLNELSNAISELKKNIKKCPVCDSELSEEKRNSILKEKEKCFYETKKDIENLSDSLKKHEEEIKNTKQNFSLINELTIKLNEKRADLNRKRQVVIDESVYDEYERLKQNKEENERKLYELINEYQNVTKSIERNKSILSRFRKIDELNSERNELKMKISKINFNKEIWKELNDEVKKLEIESVSIYSEIRTSEESLRLIHERINDRLEKINEYNKMKSEIEKLKSEIEKFQILQNCIIETQYVLREQLLNAVNEALEKIWEVLYPYSDYTNVRIMPSEEKDDYELVFKTKSGYVKVDGIASGGERALACLALRIALAMVLTPKLSWLILDEPTHNLDEEGIKMLAVALHDHVPKLVEQIFLITHDENLKDAVSGKFIVVERNKTIPEISNVEEIYY